MKGQEKGRKRESKTLLTEKANGKRGGTDSKGKAFGKRSTCPKTTA